MIQVGWRGVVGALIERLGYFFSLMWSVKGILLVSTSFDAKWLFVDLLDANSHDVDLYSVNSCDVGLYDVNPDLTRCFLVALTQVSDQPQSRRRGAAARRRWVSASRSGIGSSIGQRGRQAPQRPQAEALMASHQWPARPIRL